MNQAWMHWSGGKDSAYALLKTINDVEINVAGLVTSMSEEFRRISMHGVREELLDAQAKALSLPVEKLLIPKDCSMKQYDDFMYGELIKLKKRGAQSCLFGDIYLEDLRNYRETQIKAAGLQARFPIWKEASSATLARRIIDSGIKAVIVCVSGKYFDQHALGKEFNHAFLDQLPSQVDPCGENGEFHTFVYDSPQFAHPIPFRLGDIVNKLYTPGDPDNEEECDCCKTWDTEFFFQDLHLA